MSDARLEKMAEGAAAMARGEFYEAHELWEEVWDEADDPEHNWLQGLIQIATGFHKLVQGHAGPATHLLGRALERLADAPGTLYGVDVVDLKARATRMRAGLLAGELPDPRRG